MRRCPVGYAFNQDGNVVRLRCGSWCCSECMRTNARKWSWRVRIHVKNRGGHAWFWTFTMRRRYKQPAEAYEVLPKLWDNLRHFLKRNGLKKWSYCAFVEGQPKRKEMPHFHVVSMEPCPKRIKDVAMWCGFGYEAYEEKVYSDKAAYYVAKYASKQGKSTPRGFRRVRSSQDWARLPDQDGRSLIVRAKGETIADYLDRVSSITSVSIDRLADNWLHKSMSYHKVD